MKLILAVVCIALAGCASQKTKAAIPGTHPGPAHMECTGLGPQTDCEQVQSILTDKDDRQVLTPLGCAGKKLYILRVFWIGAKNKPVCVSEIEKEKSK